MIRNIAYFNILGLPIIVYLGILTILFLFLTALIAILNKKGYQKIPFSWHSKMAKVTITLAIIHALSAIFSNI